MKISVSGVAGVLCVGTATAVMAQTPPTEAIYIPVEQVEAVNALPGVDRQLRIVDMGEYQLAVGIIHRGATQPRPAAAQADDDDDDAPAPAAETCGVAGSAADSMARGIAHDLTTETYVIVSGTGTLVTGGHIANGRPSDPEGTVSTILNGPSCSGAIAGDDVVSRVVKEGDIIIIPAGVPHGWTDIADHVDYLSIRPDMEEVLESGYVHPTIQEMEGQ